MDIILFAVILIFSASLFLTSRQLGFFENVSLTIVSGLVILLAAVEILISGMSSFGTPVLVGYTMPIGLITALFGFIEMYAILSEQKAMREGETIEVYE